MRGDLHALDSRLQQRMLTPSTRPLSYGKALAVVFRKDHNLLGLVVTVKHFHLNFHIGIHAYIEDLPHLGKPGIRPAAIVTDSNGRNTIDDAQRSFGSQFLHPTPPCHSWCAKRWSALRRGTISFSARPAA